MQTIVIAGVQSGCGKTTATLAIIQYFMACGKKVCGFKAGPDFLDPLWHKKLTGLDSYNLDTRMTGLAECQDKLLQAQQKDIEVSVVEGVMGLFDGRTGVGQDGSTLNLAQQLGLDIWLVVDAKGMSGSIVPLVSGFKGFAEQCGVKITGIIANRVGSRHHAELLQAHLSEYHLPPLIAWLDKSVPPLPERHLGLVRPDDSPLPDFRAHLNIVEHDLPAFLAAPLEHKPQVLQDKQPNQPLKGKNIAVARDDACCFIYPANIDWLKQQGANIHYFSLLEGDKVPDNADALWLPGGYPELYAEQLSASDSLLSIKKIVQQHKPVLAECGGMMLLGQTLTDLQGQSWTMAGVLPIETKMTPRLASLGYRECRSGTFVGLKGHEFHHSIRESYHEVSPAFDVSRGDHGIISGSLIASYIHWYFPSSTQASLQFFLAVNK